MVRLLQKLDDLVDEVRGASGDRCPMLLRSLTEILLKPIAVEDNAARDQLTAIVARLIESCDIEVRRQLSLQLADEPAAPPLLITLLANDECSVAAPILRSSPVLEEGRLIDIATRRTQAHLAAIAERSRLGPRISDVILAFGDEDVVERLLRNKSAAIKAGALARLAKHTLGSPRLQAALADRRDMPHHAVMALLGKLSDEERDTLLLSLLDTEMEHCEGLDRFAKDPIVARRIAQIEQQIDDMARQGSLSESLLVRFVEEQRHVEFPLAFAKLAKIDLITAEKVLADETGKSMAVFCRAIGLGIETFTQIVLAPLTKVSGDPTQVLPLLNLYKRLSSADAHRAIQLWHARRRNCIETVEGAAEPFALDSDAGARQA